MGDEPFFFSSFFHHEEEELMHGGFWAFSPPDHHLDFFPTTPQPVLAVADPPSMEPTPVPEHTTALAPTSAFMKYRDRISLQGLSSEPPIAARNIHHRVINLLRRIPAPNQDSKRNEGNRGFRHMMRERQRRERLSQSYADLYSMLSSRSKADKNSIVQSATIYLRELKKTKEDLRRRNEELRSKIAKSEGRTEGGTIRIRVADPSSTLDSMIGALRCLKDLNVRASSIESNFSGQELSAVFSIETKTATGEVERAVEGALTELGMKLSRSCGFFPQISRGERAVKPY